MGAPALCFPATSWSCSMDWSLHLLSARGTHCGGGQSRVCILPLPLMGLVTLGKVFTSQSLGHLEDQTRWCTTRASWAVSGPQWPQEEGAATLWGTARDKETSRTDSSPWQFLVLRIHGHMKLTCPLIRDIEIYQLIKMVSARFLHCKVN